MFIVQEIDSGDPLISSVLNLNIFLGKSSTLTNSKGNVTHERVLTGTNLLRALLTIAARVGEITRVARRYIFLEPMEISSWNFRA
jgi:hypothetical protein